MIKMDIKWKEIISQKAIKESGTILSVSIPTEYKEEHFGHNINVISFKSNGEKKEIIMDLIFPSILIALSFVCGENNYILHQKNLRSPR